MGNPWSRAKIETQEIERLQLSIVGFQQQKKNINLSNRQKKQISQKLKTEKNDLINKIQKNRTLINTQNREITDLNSENTQKRQKNDLDKAQLARIKQQNTMFQKQLDQLKIKILKLGGNKQIEDQIERIKNQNIRLATKIDSIKASNTAIDAKCVQQQNSLSNLKARLVSIQTEFKKTRESLNFTQSQQLQLCQRSLQLQLHPRQGKIEIVLTLQNSKKKRLVVSNKINVSCLKKFIYRNHDQLTPPLFVLLFNQKKLNQNHQLCELFKEKIVQLKQRKSQVWQLNDVKSDKNIVDPTSDEKGVAFLKCGHCFSRSGIGMTIEYQLNSVRQSYVSCPFLKQDGSVCGEKIDVQLWQLIAGFDKDQSNSMGQRISQNLIKQTCTQCPKCSINISKQGMEVKKVRCVIRTCNTAFCFQCSQVWKSRDDQVCSSQKCDTIRKLIALAPWDRVFPMYNESNRNNEFPVKVPNLRACPACKSLIMNKANCKHTTCPCGVHFCFVCLSVRQDTWSCGKAYQYCGNVAPNQTLTSLKSKQQDLSRRSIFS